MSKNLKNFIVDDCEDDDGDFKDDSLDEDSEFSDDSSEYSCDDDDDDEESYAPSNGESSSSDDEDDEDDPNKIENVGELLKVDAHFDDEYKARQMKRKECEQEYDESDFDEDEDEEEDDNVNEEYDLTVDDDLQPAYHAEVFEDVVAFIDLRRFNNMFERIDRTLIEPLHLFGKTATTRNNSIVAAANSGLWHMRARKKAFEGVCFLCNTKKHLTYDVCMNDITIGSAGWMCADAFALLASVYAFRRQLYGCVRAHDNRAAQTDLAEALTQRYIDLEKEIETYVSSRFSNNK